MIDLDTFARIFQTAKEKSLPPERDVVIVLGKTGYGKSVRTKQLIQGEKRLLVHDMCMEYPVRYVSEDELIDMLDSHTGGLGAKYAIGTSQREDVDLLGSIAFIEGDNTLVLEEMSTIYRKGERQDAWLDELIFQGRHRRCNVIATAQRAMSIPIDLRSQAHRVISFYQTEQADTKWLEDYFGDFTEDIFSLPPLTCLDANRGEITRYSIHWSHNQLKDVTICTKSSRS